MRVCVCVCVGGVVGEGDIKNERVKASSNQVGGGGGGRVVSRTPTLQTRIMNKVNVNQRSTP